MNFEHAHAHDVDAFALTRVLKDKGATYVVAAIVTRNFNAVLNTEI